MSPVTAQAVERLDRFATFTERNWDSYDADPITPAAVEAARTVLQEFPAGVPYPLPDGGIQLEFACANGWDLEVECNPDGATFGYLHWHRASRQSDEADGLTLPQMRAKCREVL